MCRICRLISGFRAISGAGRMFPGRRLRLVTPLLVVLLGSTASGQQTRPAKESEPTGERDLSVSYENGAEAYEAGAYDEALSRFIELQVERPQDPALMMNIGSTYYRKGDLEAAKRGFGAAAATSAEDAMRAQAVYNLGNVAYREERLEEAVELYKSALEIDPDDMDAKFNLEFVRNEIRRQQEQQQGDQQDQESGEQGEAGEGDQKDDSSSQSEGENEPPAGSQSPQPQGSDGDRDGLPDQTEASGENPTDPTNPDSDGDGLSDGEEDRNANGRVDPGETDPNNPDTNGNGIGDREETTLPETQSETGEAQPTEQAGELSEEEAERYLQALEEGRPQNRGLRGTAGRRGQEKDW